MWMTNYIANYWNGYLKPIGRCSQCGGIVSVPRYWIGVGRPPATCEICGATADHHPNLPVIPTIPLPKKQVPPPPAPVDPRGFEPPEPDPRGG